MVGGLPVKGLHGTVRQVYQGKFIDRFPELPTAGKLIPIGETAATCLTEILPRYQTTWHRISTASNVKTEISFKKPCRTHLDCSEVTPSVVKKFRNTSNPPTGKERVFYGRANDPDIASYLTHGITTTISENASLLANPPPKTYFQQKIKEKKESVYLSSCQAPLGKSHDQSLRLPKELDVNNTRFGTTVKREISAADIINPRKTFDEVQKEAQEGHELYVLTHNDYYVGEAVNRKYNPSTFNRFNLYGKETPHFNDGRNIGRTLHWLHDLQMNKSAKIVSKISDDFNEKFQPQVGKVHDPLADTLNVPPDHTFGILIRPEEYGVGDLLHNRLPSEYLKTKDRERAVFTAIRQNLKKANYHNFDTLLHAFQHYDKDGDRKISREDLKKACCQLNLDLDDELLDSLFNYCDLDKDGFIDYLEFANFLNWKDKMAIQEYEEKIITKGKKPAPFDLIPANDSEIKVNENALLKQEDLVPMEPGSLEKTARTLSRPTDRVFSDYRTTSSQYNAVVGGIPSSFYPLYGIPTIRSDIPAPRFRRISDTTNYGDQATMYALLYPSVSSNKGVYEKDFFRIRSKEEIADILRNIGVKLSDESFDEVWRQACLKDHRGKVCVESIRNVLDEMQALHLTS